MTDYEKLKILFMDKLKENNYPVDLVKKTEYILDACVKDYSVTFVGHEITTTDQVALQAAEYYCKTKLFEGRSKAGIKLAWLTLKNAITAIGKPLNQITELDLKSYLYEYQVKRKISDRTKDLMLGFIKRYFEFCVNEGFIDKNPARNISKIKFEVHERGFMNEYEVEMMRKACQTLQERAIFEVLLSSACRVSELTNLKRSDIDMEAFNVHIFGKGKKHRPGYFKASAFIALKEYLDSRTDDNEYVIVSTRGHHPISANAVEQIISRIYDRCKDQIHVKVTPHILRHTAATMAMRRGMPVEQLSKWLGHTSIDTTMIYAKIADDEVKNSHTKFAF